MFKSTLTAAAFALSAAVAHAAPAPLDLETTPAAESAVEYEQTAAYCEWVTVYDFWGNWVTVWQCY